MSAPFLWIFIPLLGGIFLFIFRRWERVIQLVGLSISLALIILAGRISIGTAIPIRLWQGLPSLVIGEGMSILGARLIIDDSMRPILILINLAVVFWFCGAFAAHTSSLLYPLCLCVSALVTTALAISPGFYAPLILEIAALLFIPVLSPPGSPSLRGVRRFMTYQTLGMGLIMLANWAILYATIHSELQISALIPLFVLGLGFAMVLPIFPFHTWITMIAGETEIYGSSFGFLLFPAVNVLLILDSLTNLSATAFPINPQAVFQGVAVYMIFTAGIWAFIDRHLGRITGFAIIQQIGTSLLIVSLANTSGPNPPSAALFYPHFLALGIGLAVTALSLNILHTNLGDIRLESILGAGRRFPIASCGLLAGIFSLAGLPLFASFPISSTVWSELARESTFLGLVALSGHLFIFIAGLRILETLLRQPGEERWRVSESRIQIALLSVGLIAIILLGFLPGLADPILGGAALAPSSPLP
jgi:formate hydrogenlyase subunit 3/multisubunit Na+/H+ antiporter MnhD subunit